MPRVARFVLPAILLAPLVAAAQQARPIVIKAATILDGKGHVLRNTTIVVEGARIARIGGAVPAGAVTYDLTGLTVMPGLIDTHTHIVYHFGPDGRYAGGGRGEPPDEATLYDVDNAVATLDAGFTTIQSPGAMADKNLRDAIARGIIPGPRIVTSLNPLTERSGPPDKLRELVRERKTQGADFIKLFASKSIREGGEQTMTDEQLQAACGEAKSLGLRTIVHAHSAASAKAVTLAGCTAVEHGAYVTDEVFDLMEQHGTYYDPNIGLVLQNYIENKAKFFGIGNYNEEGFAFMEKGIQITLDTFKKALDAQEPEDRLRHRRRGRRARAQLRGDDRARPRRRAGSDGGDRVGDVGVGRIDAACRTRSARSRRGFRPTSSPSTAIRCRTSPPSAARSS